METLEQSGNPAETLRVYDRLRLLLCDALAVAPSPAAQDVYRRLLGETTATTA
jgi:DNA-binding SARP family transcriptional activator